MFHSETIRILQYSYLLVFLKHPFASLDSFAIIIYKSNISINSLLNDYIR
jgi:hypothetical protein